MVELIIEVTIIQDVGPGMGFCNPGYAIFQSLPDNNTLNLLPVICSNTSCGGVRIRPVDLEPWILHFSELESTPTELPANPRYVSIGEWFNMTIRACMPESWTGIVLNVTLPHNDTTHYATVTMQLSGLLVQNCTTLLYLKEIVSCFHLEPLALHS